MKDRELNIKVTVDKSHLFTLGEKMYRESIEFIRELVNNACDADATEARVMVTDSQIAIPRGDRLKTKSPPGLDPFQFVQC